MSFISSRPSVGGILLLVLVSLGIEWATRRGTLYLDHEFSFGTITTSGSESIVLAVPPSILFFLGGCAFFSAFILTDIWQSIG